jgi:hypothetical protein
MKTEILTHSDRYWATHKLYVNVNKKNVVKWANQILQKGLNSKTDEHKKLISKIENWIKKSYSDKTIENILSDIANKNSEYVIDIFAKEITRQNISEKVQKEHLTDKGFTVVKLSASCGPRFTKNKKELTTKKQEGLTSRSFDFQINRDNSWVDYVLGKTTFSQGGGQNSAKSEIVQFLEAAQVYCDANPNSKIRFIVLIDGDSYTEKDLKKFNQYENDRVKVFNSDTYN